MVLIYSITIFANAALLFTVQPMVAKMILPFLGGSPAVWNTSMVFYQACLLAGYAYAHFASSWLGIKRHALVHLTLVFAAISVLPIALPVHWFIEPSPTPVQLVLAVLSVSIGLPFFLLSAGAPLLQKWFAHGPDASSRDPYFLYAASNAGSMVGLLAYPLFFERTYNLSRQSDLWFKGYLALAVLILFCALYFLRPMSSNSAPTGARQWVGDDPLAAAGEVGWPRRMRWLLWSLVPSSLLLGVTSYVTTDIVSVPLFWVVPLAAYLLSFVIAFARPGLATHVFLVRRQAFLLLGAAITIWMYANTPEWLIIPLHLIAFFATALVCHGQLAQDRPPTARLTEYYLWISVGGVLGGAFNALIAPLIFKSVIEYPLAIAAAAFLRPYVGAQSFSKIHRRMDWLLPPAMVALVVAVTLAMKQAELLPPGNERFLLCGVAGVICLVFAYRPVRFGLGLTAMAVALSWYPAPFGRVLFAERSFFGSYRATLDRDGKKHVLIHGTTIHGAQSTEPQLRLSPMTYYHRTGPAGQVLTAYSKVTGARNVAIVGLGTGALACHGSAKQQFVFYEIDPLVEKIARDPQLFSYLRDCPPKSQVVIGDARISLADSPDGFFDLFVLDAFTSDAIPIHLLTKEALELYLSKTAAQGILLFHISNRYMDLAPVLDRLARELKLVALIQFDVKVSPQESDEGKTVSRWVMLGRGETAVAGFLKDTRWQRLDGRLGGELWTDDFSDVLKVISWFSK